MQSPTPAEVMHKQYAQVERVKQAAHEWAAATLPAGTRYEVRFTPTLWRVYITVKGVSVKTFEVK